MTALWDENRPAQFTKYFNILQIITVTCPHFYAICAELAPFRAKPGQIKARIRQKADHSNATGNRVHTFSDGNDASSP